ncbi:7-cyano-7-deazaguanine synthase [Rhodococcus triatomae]
MHHYTLSFELPADAPGPSDVLNTFFWPCNRGGSFVSTLLPTGTRLGPSLAALGPVPAANIDLVWLATLVYAADRSTPRQVGAVNWSRRDLALEVPVSDPRLWEPVRTKFENLLAFLSGDRWTLRFHTALAPAEETAEYGYRGTVRAVLLSGGADSAVGALLSRTELGAARQLLVSHVGLTNIAQVQTSIAAQITKLIDGSATEHQQVHLSRRSKQYENTRFPNETSSRTRSLLFLALGLAMASIESVPLLIPENGFASLNPPLTADQRGTLSTRTTHPVFLETLSELVSTTGAHAQIHNPMAALTKGEMFGRVRDLVGQEEASRFLSSTHSCGHTGQRSFGKSPLTHCGVCFGCLLRRASFLAADLEDKTEYLSAGVSAGVDGFLRRNSVETSLRTFVRRGLATTELAAMPLPRTLAVAEARDICTRAIDEMELLFR